MADPTDNPKDVSVAGKSKSISTKDPHPRGRSISGPGGQGGLRAWVKPAVIAAALPVVGALTAGPTPDAQAAPSAVRAAGAIGPSGEAVPIGDLPAPSGV